MAETPALSAYAHFFEQLFKRQPHVLSQAEEELLAGAQEIFGAAGETFGILDNADMVFPIVSDDEGNQVQLTHGNFISLLESKNREVRKEAYQAMYATYEQFQHTYAKTLQTNVKVHAFTISNQLVRQLLRLMIFQNRYMIPWWKRSMITCHCYTVMSPCAKKSSN